MSINWIESIQEANNCNLIEDVERLKLMVNVIECTPGGYVTRFVGKSLVKDRSNIPFVMIDTRSPMEICKAHMKEIPNLSKDDLVISYRKDLCVERSTDSDVRATLEKMITFEDVKFSGFLTPVIYHNGEDLCHPAEYVNDDTALDDYLSNRGYEIITIFSIKNARHDYERDDSNHNFDPTFLKRVGLLLEKVGGPKMIPAHIPERWNIYRKNNHCNDCNDCRENEECKE